MKKRPREPKPIDPVLASASGPALIKYLASCNTTVRSQSLRLLQSWLVSQSNQLSGPDIKKLWKGLFYCLWHADKTPNQVALIDRLTSLFLSLQPSLSLEFFRGFLLTLRREWPGIDRLRLDKFYLLIRRFVRALFQLMRLRKWDCEILGEYMGILQNDGFLAEDKLQGNGVNYHLVSVFLEELKGARFPVTKEVVDEILRPFFAVLMGSKDRVLLGKIKSCVFEELVKVGKGLLEKKRTGVCCNGEDADVLLGVVALRMELSGRFYEVGSSADCVQGNRKVVFGLHEQFLKLEKELELSGMEITIPEFIDVGGDGDEVPQLIPIDYNSNNGTAEMGEPERGNDKLGNDSHSDARSLRKSKKTAKEMDGNDKKAKRKKKKKRKDGSVVSDSSSVIQENGDEVTADDSEKWSSITAPGNNLSDNPEIDGSAVLLNESVISNLQKQFEKVAAEAGSDSDECMGLCDSPQISMRYCMHANKRKRTKGAEVLESGNSDSAADTAVKSVEKSAKKVRFAMKNNLVWKPQNPLPPESLRLPPSVTPRGSALKKGVPPGPIIEMPPTKKKAKHKKKSQRVLRSATPVTKRLKKIRTGSI